MQKRILITIDLFKKENSFELTIQKHKHDVNNA